MCLTLLIHAATAAATTSKSARHGGPVADGPGHRRPDDLQVTAVISSVVLLVSSVSVDGDNGWLDPGVCVGSVQAAAAAAAAVVPSCGVSIIVVTGIIGTSGGGVIRSGHLGLHGGAGDDAARQRT